MMANEVAILLVVVSVLVVLAAIWAVGVIGFFLVLKLRGAHKEARRSMESLARRVERLEGLATGPGLPEREAAPELARPAEPARAAPAPAPAVEAPAAEVCTGAAAAPPAAAGPPVPAGWARLEGAVGRRWMIWAGALALFLATAFFVKLAFDYGWIGPTARVVLGILLGTVLLGLGEWAVRRRMPALGQGLMGGGLALLYVSLFAAFSLYHLIPQTAAFGAMVLLTIGGTALAVLHNALAISLLALVGGLLTPVLLSTGVDARDTLFSYLTMLDLSVLGVAVFKRWRALDAVALAGTAMLFTGWFSRFYAQPAMVPTLLWLLVFYVVFLVLPFVHHLRRRTDITVERFLMALVNATLAFACAYDILWPDHRHVLGFLALGMAACYVVLGTETRWRIPSDSRGVFGFTALAVLLLTAAVPIHLKLQGITVVWALEGPVLLYLGYRYRYLPVRLGALGVLALAAIRLFAVHWPLHEALFVPIWNRYFGTALCVPVAAGAFAAVHQWCRGGGWDRACKLVASIGGGLLLLVILHGELHQWSYYSGRPDLDLWMPSVVWAIGALAFLWGGLQARSAYALCAGAVPLSVALVLAARAYGGPVAESYVMFANARFACGLAAALSVLAYGLVMRARRPAAALPERTVSGVLAWAGVLALLVLLSLEAYTYCSEEIADPRKARWMALMSLSVVWAVYAAAMLGVGFWRRTLPLRLAALALFGVTAAKVIAVDIAGVRQIYRVVSFFVLGLLMIGAGYLYHRIERRFEAWVATRKE